MKTKKFKDFVSMEVGLDLTKNENKSETIDLTKYTEIYKSKSPEELKKAAETIGLDLTKNLSKRIDLI
jgi:F420-0:gamma-glutamyl ligase-like protein